MTKRKGASLGKSSSYQGKYYSNSTAYREKASAAKRLAKGIKADISRGQKSRSLLKARIVALSAKLSILEAQVGNVMLMLKIEVTEVDVESRKEINKKLRNSAEQIGLFGLDEPLGEEE